MSLIVSWKLRVSRIDAEALADCSLVLVQLQRSYDRGVSSLCVAPRMSEHWQNVVVCRCSLHCVSVYLLQINSSCRDCGKNMIT